MKTIRVLLVEDNPGDADLTRDSLEDSDLPIEFSVAVDGEDAVDFLLRRGHYAQVERPDLIILDLNLPKMHGCDVLAVVKQHEHLRRVPVVVLTTSDAERDVVQSYALGANCYVTKPGDLKAFQMSVKSIEQFWLKVAKLP
jgi:two-component system response regulator